MAGEGAAAGPGGELGPRGAGTGDGGSRTVWLGEERGVRGLRALGRLGFVRRLSGLPRCAAGHRGPHRPVGIRKRCPGGRGG